MKSSSFPPSSAAIASTPAPSCLWVWGVAASLEEVFCKVRRVAEALQRRVHEARVAQIDETDAAAREAHIHAGGGRDARIRTGGRTEEPTSTRECERTYARAHTRTHVRARRRPYTRSKRIRAWAVRRIALATILAHSHGPYQKVL
eukprot:3412911-Pleurochrysis_carterae.AAC.4